MKVFDEEDIKKYLPTVLSDLKHASKPEDRVPTPDNVKKLLYDIVIRGLIDKNMGGYYVTEKENDGSGREGMFIKGYVRDVWDYLQLSYDNIHKFDYTEYCKWEMV